MLNLSDHELAIFDNLWTDQVFITSTYYMTLSQKDWELPSLRIWLVESNIESGLDFPI